MSDRIKSMAIPFPIGLPENSALPAHLLLGRQVKNLSTSVLEESHLLPIHITSDLSQAAQSANAACELAIRARELASNQAEALNEILAANTAADAGIALEAARAELKHLMENKIVQEAKLVGDLSAIREHLLELQENLNHN